MRQEDIDRQVAIRRSTGYHRCEHIVNLLGLISEGEVSSSDTLQEAIEKLKTLNEKERDNGPSSFRRREEAEEQGKTDQDRT